MSVGGVTRHELIDLRGPFMYGIALCLALNFCAAGGDAVELPKVVDSRLAIELFAAEPDIVTPTGLAVDDHGRVLVVESHTHFRPDDYQGPPADRLRLFEDTDGDGRADRITTFFEGTSSTMNVAIHPDGSVYVATRNEIFRLRDTDGDRRADQRTPIAHLETKGNYPHNGLSGFAFDFEGNVYFGLGENLGMPFKLVGTDGSVASELEGGQIYRCRADGTRIEMLAFGYWNPFHLCFDTFGRLFAVDNDPDSLPPCRLMQIVRDGNYGYRYRNGRKGVHPFTAWNGELPGTLPMVAGTGEAPSGVLAYESDNLPQDYIGDLLVTSWGDHRIDRFTLKPRGASFESTSKAIVQGDENFRPVGIALAPDGSLYISDWVLKSYNVHGKGRIWRLRAATPRSVERPQAAEKAIRSDHRPLRERAARELASNIAKGRPLLQQLALSDTSPRVRAVAVAALASVGDEDTIGRVANSMEGPVDVRALAVRSLSDDAPLERLIDDPAVEVSTEAMRRVRDPRAAAALWKRVSDRDAFVAEAARAGLARSGALSVEGDFSKRPPAERLAAVLILRESHDPRGLSLLPQFLRDPDVSVRFAAVQWVGEERLVDFRQPLVDALSAGPASGRLFSGYLAAIERLEGVVREPADEWAADEYIVRALDDPKTTPEVRRWSLRMLRTDHPALTIARLSEFLTSGDPALQLEAVRSLCDSPHAGRIQALEKVAADPKCPLRLRAEAVVGLSGDDPSSRALLLQLMAGGNRALRNESLRSLRGAKLDSSQRQALESLAGDEESRELVARVLEPATVVARPAADDLAGWIRLLATSDGQRAADPEAGARIFFHQRSVGCSKCHQMEGRGARVGPELTAAGGTLTTLRLIESIVRPGKEVAPRFAAWQIVTSSGKTLVGMLVKELATGEQTYCDDKGQLFELKPGDIETRIIQANSIMPDGLANQLSVQELRDLLAYLQAPQAADD
jgi:putative membrane-bound dehydrogenase-like protein